jgi:Flp pilus assembly protein TadG
MRLRQNVSNFARHEGGAAAIIFALSFLPITAMVGASVDYGRASAAQVVIQSAVDATAIALVRTAAQTQPSLLQTQALTFFGASLNRSDLANIAVNATYASGPNGTGTVTVRASGDMPTSFMRIFGTDTVAIGATSTVEIGAGPRLRVALALDNTGSMAQSGKMDALKTATHSLLLQLQTATSIPADAYVSIIPFNTDVNIGPTNHLASWIDWTEWDSRNGTCSGRGSTQNSCSGTWTAGSHSTWTGCVMDRGNLGSPSSGAYDTNVAPPSIATPATLFPAENLSSCPQVMMQLGNDWSAMSTLVDAMQPAGNTNQAIGLAHSWASLVGLGPYPDPPPLEAGYPYRFVIILLSDGLNTADRWYTSANSIDARQRLTCDNIKAAGMTVYTVQVNTGTDPTSAVLQYCASDSSKFFLLTSASQIIGAFQQIGSDLAQIRIAR